MIAYLFREDQPPSMMAMTLIGAEGEDHQQPDVDAAGGKVFAEGNDGQAHQRGGHHEQRGDAEEGASPRRRGRSVAWRAA